MNKYEVAMAEAMRSLQDNAGFLREEMVEISEEVAIQLKELNPEFSPEDWRSSWAETPQ